MLLRHGYHAMEAAYSAGFKALPADQIPPIIKLWCTLEYLTVEIVCDVMLHENISAIWGQLCVFHLNQIDLMLLDDLGEEAPHWLGLELTRFRRIECRPTGLAVVGGR